MAALSTGSAPLSGSELAKRLAAFTARNDVRYELESQPRLGSVNKAILRARAVSLTGQTFPVEDGLVSVTVANQQIAAIEGTDHHTLPVFDFTEPPFTNEVARQKANDLALKGLTEHDPRTNGYVTANIETIFDPANVRYEQVMYAGQRARKVITQAAELIVKRDGTIASSKTMHLD